MNKLVVAAIIVILIIVVIVIIIFAAGGDPWVGNWAGKFGPDDKIRISGSSGNYAIFHIASGQKQNVTISGNNISGWGTNGVRNGNTVTWANGNIWTKY